MAEPSNEIIELIYRPSEKSFKENRWAEFDGILKMFYETISVEGHHKEIVAFLFFFDPRDYLNLRIDTE